MRTLRVTLFVLFVWSAGLASGYLFGRQLDEVQLTTTRLLNEALQRPRCIDIGIQSEDSALHICALPGSKWSVQREAMPAGALQGNKI